MFSGISNLFGGKKKAKAESGSESEEDILCKNLSAEEVDSDDMAGGLCYSDEEPESRGVFKAARSAKRGGARRGGGPAPKRRKKVV